MRELLPSVDVFLPNEVEACALADRPGDAAQAARALQVVSGGWVVVKLGPRGCLAVGPDGTEIAVPAPAVTVADTTGAGDAFNAGLVHALAQRGELARGADDGDPVRHDDHLPALQQPVQPDTIGLAQFRDAYPVNRSLVHESPMMTPVRAGPDSVSSSTGLSRSALRSQVRVEVVLCHPLETNAIDLPRWVERELVEEDDLFGSLVADAVAAEQDHFGG